MKVKEMKAKQSKTDWTPYEEAVELLYQAFYFDNYEDAKSSADYLNKIVNQEITNRFRRNI